MQLSYIFVCSPPYSESGKWVNRVLLLAEEYNLKAIMLMPEDVKYNNSFKENLLTSRFQYVIIPKASAKFVHRNGDLFNG